MRVPYTADGAYLNYYTCAAEGAYDRGFTRDRATVVAVGAGMAAVGAVRTIGRVVNLVAQVAKVIFYAMMAPIDSSWFKAHCKLLGLTVAALAAQPLQMLVSTLAIAVGIISPKAAYRMMQHASTPITCITAKEKQIWNQYKTPALFEKLETYRKHTITQKFCKGSLTREMMRAIERQFTNPEGNDAQKQRVLADLPTVPGMIMKCIVNEFLFAFECALVTPLGFMDSFHLFGANPKTLTQEQKKLTPILLLNGNYSHQATFLPLLQELSQAGNIRPVYTVNLPPNSMYDTGIVAKKVEAIKKQYDKSGDASFKVDLVGHSMGSGCIQHLSNVNLDFTIQRAISIGAPFGFFSTYNPKSYEKIFDIVGKNDLLINDVSHLDKEHQKEIDAGHLELLFHPECLEAVQEFLSA